MLVGQLVLLRGLLWYQLLDIVNVIFYLRNVLDGGISFSERSLHTTVKVALRDAATRLLVGGGTGSGTIAYCLKVADDVLLSVQQGCQFTVGRQVAELGDKSAGDA